MAQFTKLHILNTLNTNGIVPVFYHPDAVVCRDVLQAVYNGGVRIFEFTNRGDGAYDVFKELLDWAKQTLPEMILGIGSLVDGATAAQYIQAGANFVVAPVVDEFTARVCNKRKIPWMPGCGSLTEINRAESLGADIVKIFPAQQVGGPEFIKAVKAPCPWSSIMPTGGVKPDEENLKEWLQAGAYCVGLGSQLFVKDGSGRFDAAAITKATETAIAAFKKWKK